MDAGASGCRFCLFLFSPGSLAAVVVSKERTWTEIEHVFLEACQCRFSGDHLDVHNCNHWHRCRHVRASPANLTRTLLQSSHTGKSNIESPRIGTPGALKGNVHTYASYAFTDTRYISDTGVCATPAGVTASVRTRTALRLLSMSWPEAGGT